MLPDGTFERMVSGDEGTVSFRVRNRSGRSGRAETFFDRTVGIERVSLTADPNGDAVFCRELADGTLQESRLGYRVFASCRELVFILTWTKTEVTLSIGGHTPEVDLRQGS